MRILIKTLGCKANRYESDRIRSLFANKALVAENRAQLKGDKADVIIINTCTVTHVADRKSRQAISKVKKHYPKAKVIVFGCGANVHKDEYIKHKNVDYVVQKRDELEDLLSKFIQDSDDTCTTADFKSSRTRTVLKIQDGCDNFCSYCIIPFARGREHSYPMKEIIDEIKNKVKDGFKEIVITGINIGAWKEGKHDFADLIENILDKTKVERLRISSIEPQNFKKKFFELFKNPRLCNHLHISLQSGCDEVLQKMNRKYGLKLFKKICEDLRKVDKDFGITTDVIVGFPNETDEYFQKTYDFIEKLTFSKIHIFPYSKREGTAAAKMKDQVSDQDKKKRAKELSKLEVRMRKDFYLRQKGTEREVLFEMKNKEGYYEGYTDNYLKVCVKSQKDLTNQIKKVKLEKTFPVIIFQGSF